MREIRVHGRGGQGVVLASEVFVNAVIKEGKHAACFPFFGFERRGAPVLGFIRFDERPIRQKDQVYDPDCVVVFDETLFKAVDVYQGVKEPGILVVNAARPIDEIPLSPAIATIAVVDATRISLETLHAFIPNMAMLGALALATGWVTLDNLIKSVKEVLDRKIRAKSIEMLEKAYAETTVYQLPRREAAV